MSAAQVAIEHRREGVGIQVSEGCFLAYHQHHERSMIVSFHGSFWSLAVDRQQPVLVTPSENLVSLLASFHRDLFIPALFDAIEESFPEFAPFLRRFEEVHNAT